MSLLPGIQTGSKLHQRRLRLDIKKHFLTETAVKHWKGLPKEVVNAPSLTVFKMHLGNALDNVLQHVISTELVSCTR